MATWQDGPEYAPLERPAAFAVPEAVPLEDAPRPVPQPPAPAVRPAFDGPAEPVAPLAALVPAPVDQRDPQRPFDVASSNLTTPGAWAGVHGSAPHETTALVAAPAPWPEPSPAGPNGFPAPGTPQWFGPGSYPEPPPAAEGVTARQVLYAATPGLLICLALGVVVDALAPVLVVVAFVLGRRVKVAQAQVGRTLTIALGSVGVFAVIGLLGDPFGFSDWWGVLAAWSRVICLVSLVVVTAQVWARLRSRTARPDAPGPPDHRNPWG